MLCVDPSCGRKLLTGGMNSHALDPVGNEVPEVSTSAPTGPVTVLMRSRAVVLSQSSIKYIVESEMSKVCAGAMEKERDDGSLISVNAPAPFVYKSDLSKT